MSSHLAAISARLARNLEARSAWGQKAVAHELQQLIQALSPPPTLDELKAQAAKCTRCQLARSRSQVVFGTGPVPARLMIIGEAPGAEEDRQGVPFVGAAGQLLSRMLQAVGIRREDCYITNVVKCHPPRNRDPLPEEAAACSEFLKEQLRLVDPQVICILGRVAAQHLLGTPTPISRLRGKWVSVNGRKAMATFHPGYLLRNPLHKGLAYQDMKAIAAALKGEG